MSYENENVEPVKSANPDQSSVGEYGVEFVMAPDAEEDREPANYHFSHDDLDHKEDRIKP